jgi:hypothetical protein
MASDGRATGKHPRPARAAAAIAASAATPAADGAATASGAGVNLQQARAALAGVPLVHSVDAIPNRPHICISTNLRVRGGDHARVYVAHRSQQSSLLELTDFGEAVQRLLDGGLDPETSPARMRELNAICERHGVKWDNGSLVASVEPGDIADGVLRLAQAAAAVSAIHAISDTTDEMVRGTCRA